MVISKNTTILIQIDRYCAVFFGCTGQEESLAKTTARLAYRRQYGETIMEGYVLMEHWVPIFETEYIFKNAQKDGVFNLRPALVLLYFDTVILRSVIASKFKLIRHHNSCITIAYSIAYRTLYCIRKAEQMSGYTRVLQGRLLVALCVQV